MRLLLLFMFVSMVLCAKTKKYKLTYAPTGKIVALRFDSCTLYTDSATMQQMFKKYYIEAYEDTAAYNYYCAIFRNAFSTNDTLTITEESTDKLTDITNEQSLLLDLVRINRLKITHAITHAPIVNVKITDKRGRRILHRGKHYCIRKRHLVNIKTNCILLY